ncbi:MAG: hypothetical protein ABIG95_02710 [Candidatus Woesearchaeota archaeon]
MDYKDKLMGVTVTGDEIEVFVDVCKYIMEGGDVDKLGMEKYLKAKLFAKNVIDTLGKK